MGGLSVSKLLFVIPFQDFELGTRSIRCSNLDRLHSTPATTLQTQAERGILHIQRTSSLYTSLPRLEESALLGEGTNFSANSDCNSRVERFGRWPIGQATWVIPSVIYYLYDSNSHPRQEMARSNDAGNNPPSQSSWVSGSDTDSRIRRE